MAATEGRLGALHEKVAEVLIEALDGEELPGYTEQGEDGEDIVHPPKRLAPSAAIIAAATKFLKDNDITCAPAANTAVNDLREKMAEKNRQRALRAADIADAKDQMGFLTGLPN